MPRPVVGVAMLPRHLSNESAMHALLARLPLLGALLLAGALVAQAARTHSPTTFALVASSVLMFGFSWANATQLLGPRLAGRFVALALVVGWVAEQLGATMGWIFGAYHYTEVLGPRLGAVPVVIPMMWFTLGYTAYVLSNFIVWRTPAHGRESVTDAALVTFLAALILTAFDLGADPYLVYTLKAWIMVKTDGAWFGETVQGFFGWVFVSCVIIGGFRWLARSGVPVPSVAYTHRHAALPLLLYASALLYQVAFGHPVETRSIAVFAMGIPLLAAVAGWRLWQPVAGGRA
jgi:uncharacterized membrane protein